MHRAQSEAYRVCSLYRLGKLWVRKGNCDSSLAPWCSWVKFHFFTDCTSLNLQRGNNLSSGIARNIISREPQNDFIGTKL